MGRADGGTSQITSSGSSCLGGATPTSSAHALVGRAAVTLVREEIAHALCVPMSFFRMLIGELEAGQAIAPERIDIAREEIARLQRLIAALRGTPELGIRSQRVCLASVVRASRADFAPSTAHAGLDVDVQVPDTIWVLADPGALQFAIETVLNALAARGARRVTVGAHTSAGASAMAKVSIGAEPVEVVARPLCIARSWTGSDPHAIAFAIARRMGRACGMDLRQPSDGNGAVSLEVPLASLEE